MVEVKTKRSKDSLRVGLSQALAKVLWSILGQRVG